MANKTISSLFIVLATVCLLELVSCKINATEQLDSSLLKLTDAQLYQHLLNMDLPDCQVCINRTNELKEKMTQSLTNEITRRAIDFYCLSTNDICKETVEKQESIMFEVIKSKNATESCTYYGYCGFLLN